MCSVLRPEPNLSYGQTILPKGGVPPPVGYPLPVARTSAPGLTAPVHRLAVASPVRAFEPRHPDQPCAVWMRANLIAVGLRSGELSTHPGPPRARAEISLSPLHPPSTNPVRIGCAVTRLRAGGGDPRGRGGCCPVFYERRRARLRRVSCSLKSRRRCGISRAVRGRPCGPSLEWSGYASSLLPPWLGGRPVRPLWRTEPAQGLCAAGTRRAETPVEEPARWPVCGTRLDCARTGGKGCSGGSRREARCARFILICTDQWRTLKL